MSLPLRRFISTGRRSGGRMPGTGQNGGGQTGGGWNGSGDPPPSGGRGAVLG
ncbi:MAG: hypothetical protein AVDCRST_MAG64-1197 [uncultured Phycisphaerae bacterium]|uniref:Uncharacterized protein n=1 Tax=uncultured Phycisphaerae bacterium TaxID=904963 RepID=A0A6J4NLQ3_9BACT|nr:MAG: hypothetical protein AVDCRST_MAG64-1197 [uncultured Phycisphaerae bacterium]